MAIARRSHPFPSRTRKLSSFAPMVLHGRLCGRVGAAGFKTWKPRWLFSGAFFVVRPAESGRGRTSQESKYQLNCCKPHAMRYPCPGNPALMPPERCFMLGWVTFTWSRWVIFRLSLLPARKLFRGITIIHTHKNKKECLRFFVSVLFYKRLFNRTAGESVTIMQWVRV